MPPPRPIYLLLAWLATNLLQAALTPLDPDETYYWMYASQLDWGYFDHPPAVALLISIGEDWLPGALGLRLGHVLAGTATMIAIYHLLDRPRGRDLWLAAGLVFAQPMLQVYGFIATPDGPLLLFTALYLLAYRRFLHRPGIGMGAVWGLTMVGLMYSKYHGAILIAFSVLPHLGFLLRQPGAWLAALGGTALFLPHLYWQYVHDYPSFRYHLSGRDDPYQLKYTLQYIGNQLLIFSPLLLYYYVLTFLRDRARDRFEKACRWLIVGFLTFFLYTTTKGSTEAQWTALLSVPLAYLTYCAARRHPDWQPTLRKLCLATIGLLVIARLLLIAPRDWLPFDKPFDHAPWVERLATQADGRPVMVENSYRLASLYAFYSGGQPAWTFTDVDYRPNQYDLWRDDSTFHDREVMLFAQGNWIDLTAERFDLPKGHMRFRLIDSFQVVKATQLTLTGDLPRTLEVGDTYPIEITATTPLELHLDAALPLSLYVILRDPAGDYEYWPLSPLRTTSLPKDERTILYKGPLRIPRGVEGDGLQLEFGLAYRGMPPLRGQSASLPLRVVAAD